MKQVPWFERTFEFSQQQNTFPSIIERLVGTPLRLEDKIGQLPVESLSVRDEDKWSIQENVGHLIDLEPLWQGRLKDILDQKEYLRPTDLRNQPTDEARHNERRIQELLTEFRRVRYLTVEKLRNLTKQHIYQHSLHPRLKTPMRVIDLFLFVAEHDDHHLARMTELNRLMSHE